MNCENCERETDFLFPGFKFDCPAAVVRDMTQATLDRMKLACVAFSTSGEDWAEVCFRCRPLSNLEAEELLAAKPVKHSPGALATIAQVNHRQKIMRPVL